MNIVQRNKLKYSLRNNEPLPAISRPTPSQIRHEKYKVLIRPGSSKRRSLDKIRESGAYEREVYRPGPPKPDREKVKQALIDKMAQMRDAQPETKKIQKSNSKLKPVKEINRYEECKYSSNDFFYSNVLLQSLFAVKAEIKEREDWLQEMEALGEGGKYRGLIRLQILERLKAIEALAVEK